MLTPSPARIPGLSAIAGGYDALLCDVWGVLHDGVTAYPGAAEALLAARASGLRILLLTNAPRPSAPIGDQLSALGIPPGAYDDILTSGDATRVLLAERPERRIAHIGPDRDLGLYDGLPQALVDDGTAEMVVVTGLTDDTVETPEDYHDRLQALAARGLPMICANPDIVVHRGGQQVWCAGALARVYDTFGGAVTRVGKPYAPVYGEVRRRLAAAAGRPLLDSRILAIGDGLPTDVRGGHDQGFDVLFVTGGIHAADFGPLDAPDPKRVEIRLMEEGLAVTAMLPRLVW
ncbi:TIGR01459 family HAD-type hydrolase [Siculibacillus lacustris]|uniref:TIGR01459 family HAD-type hydrolase n=1 Tax=Siculibacillus lacustris TaxID=1549641 RepID=A0A4Q9VDV6_9HYPH|nr:TIGR01459 family HAD-type hydrolase [Siculibacillus lacustris]TBW32887.1 TIGR01459 family HAD-type hydrolase [Siculibacillus lacustris]